MIDSARHPSILLRAAATLARGLLWTVLLAWLLFTFVWGGVHGWIVPRIEEYRPQIERQSSHLLGVPVRIGAISAHTVGLVPWFDLKQVTLLDPAGRVALTLPRVSVALSPGSLLRRGFDQLYIDRPELDVRRTAQGKILVAGLDLSALWAGGGRASEWFFSQSEAVILGGKVRWTDELRAVEPLELSEVEFVARNSARNHEMRFAATPPPGWGSRFSLAAKFREPFVAMNSRVWDDWEGVVYADFPRVQVSQLRRYADIGMDISEGGGALRLWTDWSRGRLGAVVADLALSQVSATLGDGLAPLALRTVTGRLAGQRLDHGFEIATQDLAFTSEDGLHRQGGSLAFKYSEPGGQEANGELRADKIDLSALSSIAVHLPLGAQVHAALLKHEPRGMVEKLQAYWQGPLSAPTRFDLRGRVLGLQLTARPKASEPGTDETPGMPGVRGLSLDFEANQSAGNARLSMQDGALVLPGIFEDPNLLFDQLAAELRWKVDGRRISVDLARLKFSNADGHGEAQGHWRTAEPAPGRSGDTRFPGVLELRAELGRVEGKRVYRYLPKVVVQEARDYVREAVLGGQGSTVKVRIKGDLHDMPFVTARQGEFYIGGNVRDATLAYVPRALLTDPADNWPALTQLSGELVFDRMTIQVKGATGRLSGMPGLQIARTHALISDLATKDPTVTVNTEVRGPLAEMLGAVAQSPVAGFTGHALDKATGTGQAETRFKLTLPIADLAKSRVEGSVTLAGNDVQFSPGTPLLARVSGAVNFTDSSVSLAAVQARMYGGDLRLEGGGRAVTVAGAPGGATRSALSVVLRAQGTAHADALRGAEELGFVAQLAGFASGSAAYSGVLTLGRGVPEISLSSNLKGMAFALPAPFRKETDGTLGLRFENAVVRAAAAMPPSSKGSPALEERVSIEIDGLATLQYFRELSGDSVKVLRGAISVGGAPGELLRMPEQGVSANGKFVRLDVDAWQTALGQNPGQGAKTAPGSNLAPRRPGQDGPIDLLAAAGYLPTTWALQARELAMEGRQLHDVVAGGSRERGVWRANFDAREMNGYGEYRQGGAGGDRQLYARLARLTIATADTAVVESLLVQPIQSIPALDVMVEEFELRGKKLGRVEIEAVNRGGDTAAPGAPREWRLNKLNVTMPEAVFSATGSWAAVAAQAPQGAPGGARRPQRTVMNFRFEVADSGQLLARFGMKDVVHGGKGKLEGQVAWLGTPLQMDYPSLGGSFNVDIASGQFLKADAGIAKLLGVLSLQSLPRRLALDFRDVFSEGFSFDFVRGDVQIEQGVAMTNNLQMKGANAAVLLDGRADIAKETQDIQVVVVPEIDAGTLSLVATVINPAIGIGSFLAQLFLRRPLIQASTQEFHIDGGWADPRVTRIVRPPSQAGGTAGADAK
jgi:uncharacterized protein (TIGR02099 family)